MKAGHGRARVCHVKALDSSSCGRKKKKLRIAVIEWKIRGKTPPPPKKKKKREGKVLKQGERGSCVDALTNIKSKVTVVEMQI